MTRGASSFPHRPPDSRFWRAGNVVLALALIAQLIFFEGHRLTQNPNVRPLLEAICRRLDCQLPPFRDLNRIKAVDRALYPLNEPGSGHEFYLALINQAPFPQPYPRLALTLTALDGTPIGRRIFEPETYLPPAHPPRMPSQKMMFVHLRLAPLNRPIGGFQFKFLP